MKKIDKKIGIIGIVVVIVIAFIGYSLFNQNKKDNQNIVVKDHVISITNEKQKAYQLTTVKENQLVFKTNPHYEKGDILVSGITEQAPNGFIRKVVRVKKENNQYIVETTNGYLTDVFEEATISKRLYLTEDKVEEKNENVAYNQHQSIQYLKSGNKDKIEQNFTYKTDEKMNIEGKVSFKPWVDLSIIINHGDIQFNVIAHSNIEGSLSATYEGTIDEHYIKTIFEKDLPYFQFFVAGIPIVVTNKLNSNIENTSKINGTASASFTIDSKRALGFKYNSKNTKIKKINTRKYNGDGLKWQTQSKIDGKSEFLIDLHIITKLYDCTGADLSIGIISKLNGLVQLDNGNELLGEMDLSINPKVIGNVVIDVPIIDEKLKTVELFNKELDPFWHKKWKSKKKLTEDKQASASNSQDDTRNEDVKLTQNFVSTFGKEERIDVDIYHFDYPSNWTLKYHEKNTRKIDGNEMEVPTTLNEAAIIENKRGVNITYINGLNPALLGHRAHELQKIKIEKVADAQFVPEWPMGQGEDSDLSYLGRFVVGKVNITGAYYGYGEGSEKDYEEPYAIYTIMPVSSLQLEDMSVQPFIFGDFTFKYGTYIYFLANSPDGKFTKQEEKEIIKILSSFRHE